MVIMKLTDQSLPRSKAIWGHLTFLGVINTALPFILITWAESGIDGVDSTVASVLNSTVPLFSIVIAGALLRMEQLSVGGVSGVIVGFLGVVLMLSRGLGDSSGSLMAHLAIIFAALCYAVSSIYARKNLQQVSPVVLATGQLLVAGIVVSILAVALEDFNQQSFTQTTIMSLLWLGLLGSCLAYILYFFVLRNWGPTRTTLVTYLLPVVGVTAGVLILDEAIDWRLVTGGLLILSGVALVNWRPRQRRIEAT